MTRPKRPTAPSHLSAEARRLWRTVTDGYALEAHHERVLQAALEAWDRLQGARQTLADEGTTYHDRFGSPRKHPAISIEENARTAFLRAMRELDLDGEPLPAPRQRR